MVAIKKTTPGKAAEVLSAKQVDAQWKAERLRLNERNLKRHNAGFTISENWNDGLAWGVGAGTTIASNRLYNGGAYKAVNLQSNQRLTMRVSFRGGSGASLFIGVNNGPLGGAPQSGQDANGAYIGLSASLIPQVFIGANVQGAGTINLGSAVTAGLDIFATIVIDETWISFTLQYETQPTGTLFYRILRTALPGGTGVINNVGVSATGTTSAAGASIGQVIYHTETTVPLLKTLGGRTMFSNTKHVTVNVEDTTTSIRWIAHIPGQYDPNVPAPVVLQAHQADAPYNAQDSISVVKMANIAQALLNAGYIWISSDNGSQETAGGDSDKGGNQASLDDYKKALQWVRDHYVTDKIFLLGMSQGGLVQLNMVQRKEIGEVAAVALLGPLVDVFVLGTDPTHQVAAWAGYGNATSQAEYEANAAPYNPIIKPGYQFRQLPFKVWYTDADTIVPPDQHILKLFAKLNAEDSFPELSTDLTAGVHLAQGSYKASEILAFFEKYR